MDLPNYTTIGLVTPAPGYAKILRCGLHIPGGSASRFSTLIYSMASKYIASRRQRHPNHPLFELLKRKQKNFPLLPRHYTVPVKAKPGDFKKNNWNNLGKLKSENWI